MNYLELRPAQFRHAISECPVAYLPLGPLEWHGEHLPVGSDALQAHSFFLRAAEELGGIVVPPLFLGPDVRDAEGLIGMDTCPVPGAPYPKQKLAGSAYWIDDDTFVNVLEACLENLARAGFKVVVAHGHGPSTTVFRNHLAHWEVRFGLRLIHLQNELEDEELGFMSDHAATNETSLMMALHPDWVDLSAIADQEPLVGIWGTDPRVHASANLGNRVIRAQIEWLRERLPPAKPV